MSEEKKYPCLYGLMDKCEARKFVEENMPEPKEEPPESRALEQTAGKTHVLRFDDNRTAENIGKAASKGSMHVLKASMAPLKPQFMLNFCGMCPTRAERVEEVCRKCREQTQTKKVETPFSEKKTES